MESQACFSTDFCILVANQVLLKQAEKGSNFVASPFSLHVLLSLAAAGSRGRTLEQLLSFLGSERIDDLNLSSSLMIALTSPKQNEGTAISDPILSFINGAWIDKNLGFKPCFEDLVRNVYKANVKPVDFVTKAHEVIQEVNLWAEHESRGLIEELLPSESVDSETALILANALYFKGSWDRQFDVSKTEARDFHLLNGEIVKVPFMTSKEKERYLFRDNSEGYKVLQIPYQSSEESTRSFSMYFFLPNDEDGLKKLVQTINSRPGFLNQDLGLWEEEVTHFWIPKFKFEFEFEASEDMIELGLTLPFGDGGEFTEMVDCGISKKLYVSGIFHKSCIEVNEEGTEAAASTALTMRWCCASSYVPSFVADHPFMFMIREETSKTVFFLGSVLNPSIGHEP